MMTPEPSAAPLCVVTFIWTTAGRTLAMTASRTASILLVVRAGTVGAGLVPGCNWLVVGWLETVVLWPHCHPAHKAVPKTTASNTVSAIIAPVRRRPEV